MLELNVDFSLLNRFFGISPSKIPQYANKSLEEIMSIEAKQGNQKAQEYEYILSDPDKIKEIFKLSNIENKYAILQNLSEEDLDNLVPLLQQQDLVEGLYYFTDEKLMALSTEMPTEPLADMIFQYFDLYDVMAFMDDNAMNQFLINPEIEREHAQKYFESLDQKTLEKIMTGIYGEEEKGKSPKEYTDKLQGLSDDDFQKFMISLERRDKMDLINGLVEQDEKLIYQFDNKDLVRPMSELVKEEKIEVMRNLEAEFLVPMIQELPIELTQIVVTQIDANVFAKQLSTDFQDILKQVVIFSGDKF